MADEAQGGSVLVVDDEPGNLRLLAGVLKRGGLLCRPVTGGKLAIEAALADPPDLVLLDVRMPEMSGLEVCRWFKQDNRLRDIPIIFISGLQDSDDKVEAFSAGGVDYVSKPFHDQEVLARIRTHLHLRRLQVELKSYTLELEGRIAGQVQAVTASQMSTIFALARLAEVRDDDTGSHVARVQAFCKMLAEGMRDMKPRKARLSDAFIEHLYQASALHDIGKVGIPDAILLKPGKLTPEEFEVMKKHCEIGAGTLNAVLQQHPDNQFLRMGVEVARSHHEKWDGKGYPDGLQGEAIPLAARITALADVYDALTSKRCYHPPASHEDAGRIILEGDGSHFDPDVVAAFKALAEQFQRVRRGMQN